MKTYECEKCLKQFRQKIDYTRHLNRKFPCKNIPKYSKNGFINPNMECPDIPINKLECGSCCKIYSSISNLNKHIKICKARKKEEEENKIKTILKNQQNEIDTLKKEMSTALVNKSTKITKNTNSNNNIQNNTTNNNILLSFKDTDMTHMTIRDWEKIMMRCTMSVPACVKKLHFDPNKPENKNIIKSNLNNKFLKCYENNKWETCNQNDKIDKIYNSYSTLLEELADKWEEDEVKHSSRAVLKLRRFLEKQEDPNVYNRILHELIVIFYNNR